MSPRAVFAAALGLGLAAALAPLAAPGARPGFEAADFGRLPVLEGGRVKPLDSFARNALLLIRGTQTFAVDGKRRSAVEWLLDALYRPEAADTYKVFLIDDPEVLGALGLEKGRERRFAYWQLEPRRAEVSSQAEQAERVEAPRRSRYQTAILALERRLGLYERIKNTMQVSGSGDPAAELALFAEVVPRALRAVHGRAGSADDRKAVKVLAELLQRYRFLAGAAAFRPLAPGRGEPDDAWLSVGEAMLRPGGSQEPRPGLASFALLGRAYKRGEAGPFDSALRELEGWYASERPGLLRRARTEEVFNRLQPFVSGMALYVAGLLLVFAGWARGGRRLAAAADGALWAAFAVHTAGLAARVFLQGRPPVTNLYSSAVFVGWAGVLLGLLAERVHRRGFASAAAAASGFCTLLVAHHLTGSGDTMEMMRAVLDSNFWLATHVVVITIGYAATFVAGALGLAWVLRRHLVERPDPEATRALVALAYGVIAFGLLFSFVGTMLGGIWADQSWGRFWGWDPKENGALLIVLWCAMILHARWAGFIRERGVMIMAILGNCVTAWSWFGVNMLGVGLHSYGFMDKAFVWLTAFMVSQLLAAWLGALPPRFWKEKA